MQSWIFSIINPGIIVTWSFRNPFNNMICCSRNIIIISVEYSCAAYFFAETVMHFSSFVEKESLKEWYLFEIQICNNVLTHDFDQFIAFLLNEIIDVRLFFLTPNFWTVCIYFV